MFDFKGKAKHNAWTQAKGNSQEQARAKYIALSKELANKKENKWSQTIILNTKDIITHPYISYL